MNWRVSYLVGELKAKLHGLNAAMDLNFPKWCIDQAKRDPLSFYKAVRHIDKKYGTNPDYDEKAIAQLVEFTTIKDPDIEVVKENSK